MAESRTSKYVVKLTPSEHRDLKAKADAQGMSLADAFRNGAHMLLSDTTPDYRAADAAVSKLVDGVEEARSLLQSLTEEKKK